MSLLMEALKKAEQDKMQATATMPAPPVEDDLVPVLEDVTFVMEATPADPSVAVETPDARAETPPSESAAARGPETDAASGVAPAPPEPAGTGPSQPQVNPRAIAANLFLAKQSQRSNRRRVFLWGLVVTIALTVAAAQGYRLWQAQNRSTLISLIPVAGPADRAGGMIQDRPGGLSPLLPAAPTGAGAAVDAPTTPPDPPALPPVEPRADGVVIGDGRPAPATPTSMAETALPETKVAPPKDPPLPPPQTAFDAKAAPIPAPGKAEASAAKSPEGRSAAAVTRTEEPVVRRVEILRTHPSNTLDTRVVSAYQAFLARDFQASEGQYRQVLEQDPNHRDALAGLAAIAVASGRPEEAGGIYTRLLEINPLDPLAQAGVMAYGTDAPRSEARIKTLIDRQPQIPFLYFVLGNQYAAQANWPAAQQAFFDAVRLDPSNPDYAFNLAVSLEHLRQVGLAATHYRHALALSERRPAAFDGDIARARLQTLSEAEMR